MVVCDEQKITQAIKHLIQNAAQYCDHGTIEITLSTSYFSPTSDTNIKGLKFAISDEGVGIPENELSQIFGPFVQSSYTKKSFGSRGLGLALTERIIQVHKGIIWAQNNINKAGSTFCFILPLS
jgi:signal transduction histidine kinase